MENSNNLENKLAIRELLDRYCDGVNQRDSEIWGSTWSKNAVWEIPHLEIKNEGRDNIISIWSEAMKGYPFVQMIAQPGFIEINCGKCDVLFRNKYFFTKSCGSCIVYLFNTHFFL